MKRLSRQVECSDGFKISIQASEHHYCTPRSNEGPYTHVECGFPSEREDLLMPYCEDEDCPTDTVYCYVPREVIEAVIAKHNRTPEIKQLEML